MGFSPRPDAAAPAKSTGPVTDSTTDSLGRQARARAPVAESPMGVLLPKLLYSFALGPGAAARGASGGKGGTCNMAVTVAPPIPEGGVLQDQMEAGPGSMKPAGGVIEGAASVLPPRHPKLPTPLIIDGGNDGPAPIISPGTVPSPAVPSPMLPAMVLPSPDTPHMFDPKGPPAPWLAGSPSPAGSPEEAGAVNVQEVVVEEMVEEEEIPVEPNMDMQLGRDVLLIKVGCGGRSNHVQPTREPTIDLLHSLANAC